MGDLRDLCEDRRFRKVAALYRFSIYVVCGQIKCRMLYELSHRTKIVTSERPVLPKCIREQKRVQRDLPSLLWWEVKGAEINSGSELDPCKPKMGALCNVEVI